ncbi:MAG TPA: hypothetical protein VES67_06075 [Vicinamibacterales bacterium]|nr:hypothetical protein [Vicinamibacterales bacterium]
MRPTFQTRPDMVAAGIAAGRLHAGVLPLVKVCEAHEAAIAQLEDQPLIASEKSRRRAVLEAEFRATLAEGIAAVHAREIAPLDQEEGQLRAKATRSETKPAFMSTEQWQAERRAADRRQALDSDAMRFASDIRSAGSVEMVKLLYANALLTEYPAVVRSAGLAALDRLQSWYEADRRKPDSPRRAVYLAFASEFGAWQRANRTPVERIEELQRQKGNLPIILQASVDHILGLYRVPPARPVPQLKPLPTPERQSA